jgi:hypothetical protein
VSLGFFSDVLIPDYALQSPSLYNHEEGVWVWKYDGSDMFMDIGGLGWKCLFSSSSSSSSSSAEWNHAGAVSDEGRDMFMGVGVLAVDQHDLAAAAAVLLGTNGVLCQMMAATCPGYRCVGN